MASYFQNMFDAFNDPASTFIPARLRASLGLGNPVKNEHIPALRAIYRDVYPDMKPEKLQKVVTFASKFAGHKLNDKFDKAKGSLAQYEAVRDLSKNQREVFTDLADIVEQNDMSYNVPHQGASTQQQGRPTLRSRYILPGENTLQESKEQQTFDTSQAEMFSWHGGPEVGISSLELENRRNQALRFMKPFETRPNFDQAVMPFEMPWEYQQVDKGLALASLEDQYIRTAHEIMVKHLPPAFTVLGDTQFANQKRERIPGPEDTPLQKSQFPMSSPYNDIVQLPMGYSPDPSYPLPMGFANYMKLKLDRPDYWREPLHPKAAPDLFVAASGQASGQVYY